MARVYTVTHPGVPQKDGDTVPFKKYAANQTDAATHKRDLWEASRDTGIKRNDIEIDEIDVPTDKKGLIAWLNENAI